MMCGREELRLPLALLSLGFPFATCAALVRRPSSVREGGTPQPLVLLSLVVL